MKPVVHGSFTIVRSFPARRHRVFAAWADVETKARWFIGPEDRWTLRERKLDFRVGGREVLAGDLREGPSTRFVARYHDIVPDRRLVYDYDMHVGTEFLSVSLATVELEDAEGGGTRMTFTEQAAFLDGADGTASREGGTAAHFDRMGPVLIDPHEIFSTRVLNVPRDAAYGAFADPRALARWWGPRDFRNTFEVFDLRPGGAWRFVMHGPDGTDHPNAKRFIDVVPGERVSFAHEADDHAFTMSVSFLDLGPRSQILWRMRFHSLDEVERIRSFVIEANEQNLDRLEAHLRGEL